MTPVNLRNLDLDYSYVVEIAISPGQVDLVVDLVRFPPKDLVFDKRRIRITGFRDVAWSGWGPPAGNADGTIDWGSVDEITLGDGLTVLTGDFGTVRLSGGAHVIEMDSAE